MNDSKIPAASPYGERRRATDEPVHARSKAEGAETYSNWLDRGQKMGGRHSAITRNLYNWSCYKSWADKVRNSWEGDK
jgi:hypothetical protein